MILKGHARGGAKDLALHLLKEENEHVEVHELRGFTADTLVGAMNEAYAISRGTHCKQFLYSLSLNPPQTENVPVKDFMAAIEKVEQQLGLSGQPRAIVFHEKEGRRHAHCVWSRVDVREMKAVQLSYDRNQLRQLSRELFLEHGWTMPDGLLDSHKRDPRNYTLAQWQQAKRTGQSAKDIKAAIQDAWTVSDDLLSFTHALEERGFKLARGNKSRFVAVDVHGEVYAIARQLNTKSIRAKQIKARLGHPKILPDVETAHQIYAHEMRQSLEKMDAQLTAKNETYKAGFEARRARLVKDQRRERHTLHKQQDKRSLEEARTRQARFRKGLGGLWDRLRGEHKRIRLLNEREAENATKRDRLERDKLIQKHLSARRHLNLFKKKLRETYNDFKHEIEQDKRALQQRQNVHERTRKPQQDHGPDRS